MPRTIQNQGGGSDFSVGYFFRLPWDSGVEFPLGGWSPISDLAGQTANTGHFLHPTAMATGQSVMVFPQKEGACSVAIFMNKLNY